MEGIIYRETLFSKWSTTLLASITAIILSILIYQILIGPIGTRPAPNWILFIISILLFGITVNFSRLKIIITTDGISIGYGILKTTRQYEVIDNCYLDEASTTRYGGWGIRLGRVKGKWRLVYNVIGGPRVVVRLKKGKIKEIVFSTIKPEQVMKLIKKQVETKNK